MASPAASGSGSRPSGGSTSRSYLSQAESDRSKHDRRRREKDKERVEKERVRKEHARKVLEEQKINKARRKWQKQTEFLCTIKFRNTLPDPSLGPHFLELPLDLDKYVKYKPTMLEQNYKWKLHHEHDLGVPIDVIDPRNYLLPKTTPPLDPEDEALLNWREGPSTSKVGKRKEDLSISARRKAVDTSVTWLKKTVYLTNDPFDPVHQFKSEQQAQADKQKELENELAQGGKLDRKTQIEESFNQANGRKPLVHQDENKRHLTPEWCIPVLPDVSLWPNTYTTVVFDKDPAADETVKGSEARKRKRARDALICNVKRTTFEGSSHEVITGSYLMPKDMSTNGSTHDDEHEQEEEDGEEGSKYDFVKDYKFNIVQYAQSQYDGNPHLLFVIDPEANMASYCKLSARVELANLPREQGQPSTGRGAIVTRRELSKDEKIDATKKIHADLQMQGNIASYMGVNDGNGAAMENGYSHEAMNGRSDERGLSNGASDHDQESVLSMAMESEASNMAVKGTESSEGDMLGVPTDENDSE